MVSKVGVDSSAVERPVEAGQAGGSIPSQPTLPQRIEKPWGFEYLWARTDHYAAKILSIRMGEALSLQYHEKKEETLFVSFGEVMLEIGDGKGKVEALQLSAGSFCHLPPKTIHRITATSNAEIIEVSTPELDDVVRLEDRYGRVE